MADVRGISNLGGSNILSSVGGLLTGDTKEAFDNFVAKVNASQVLGGKNQTYLLSAFGEVGNAIIEVLSASIGGVALPTKVGLVNIAANVQEDGRARYHTYTIKQIINVCKGDSAPGCDVDVDLTVKLNFARAPLGGKGETSTSLSAAAGLTADITGTIKNAGLSAQLKPAASGNHVAFEYLDLYMDEATVTGWDSATNINLEFSGMLINIPLTLQQLGVASPVSLEATLTGTGEEVVVDVGILGRKVTSGATETTTDRIAVDFGALADIDVKVDASIKDTLGESFELEADVLKADGLGSGAYRFVSNTVKTCTSGVCTNDSTMGIEGETATDFVNAFVSLDFEAILSGVEPVNITAAVQRSSSDLFSLDSFKLVSEGNSVDLSAEIDWEGKLASLNASNADGLKLVITSNTSGARSGTLVTASGQKVADVVEQDGKIILNFVDGTVGVL